MENKNLKILIVGAGAIGGITAAHLSKSGYRVEVVDVNSELVGRINDQGFHITGVRGDFVESMAAFNDLAEVKEKKDMILLATKANALPRVVHSLQHLLKKNTAIVSLQNGMCEDYLEQVFGSERVIGCVVGWGATVKEPGEIEMTSTGHFTIGSLAVYPGKHFKMIKEALGQIAPVQCTNNIYGHLYAKLIINSCITTLGAISGQMLGQILLELKMRRLFLRIIAEAVNVGEAAGILIEKYAGKLDFVKIAHNQSWTANLKNHLLILLVGCKYRRLKSSSLQSLERGLKTEIDFLNGYISQKGKELNIQTPVNDFLIKLVKEIEVGTRIISKKNFNMISLKPYVHTGGY